MIGQWTPALSGSAPVSHGYASPMVVWRGDVAERSDAIWWVVFVGLAYAAALAWAGWCRSKGGSAEVNFSVSGFKVVCKK